MHRIHSPVPLSRAFSLLELIIVVAVVALISSALMPSLYKVNPKALKLPGSELDRALQKLPWGNVVVNHPEQMSFGSSGGVRLVLSRTKGFKEIESAMQEAGINEQFTVRVSDRMKAELVSLPGHFDIVPVGPQEQNISAEHTEWRWEVQPRKTGTLRLTVLLSCYLNDGSGDAPRPVIMQKKDVVVRVDSLGSGAAWAMANWQVTTGVAGLLGWMIAKLSGKKKEAGG